MNTLRQWQLVGPVAPDGGGWKNWDRRRVIFPGPGSRVEFIRATPPYNWAEGSRAIEARSGAAKMRHSAWMAWQQARWRIMLDLNIMLAQLGLPDVS